MTLRRAGIIMMTLIAVCAVCVEGALRTWPGTIKRQIGQPRALSRRVEPVTSPRAAIGGPANGVYCAAPWDNGIAVHDLGFIPAGFNVSVTVESFSDNFNPVAAVLVPSIGQMAGNTIKTTTFYDDDSGGDGDPQVDFVAPQAGTYLLMVNDLTDTTPGCYRYQMLLR